VIIDAEPVSFAFAEHDDCVATPKGDPDDCTLLMPKRSATQFPRMNAGEALAS
jgi:hypothetical protein